ncbi:MAG: hypothetical protein J6D03_11400 [Clostridia bacterium]|nr:hypothetical protein [Clostridia bacterium]
MKKVVTCLLTVFFIFIICHTVVTANDTSTNNVLQGESTTGELIELKEREMQTIEDYKVAYGSDTYGLAAYILNRIRIYSIPLCFVGIAIAAIYQYVLGIRKLDVRDKGFNIMIAIITVAVICQVLPLIFAIVVKGWRG